MHRFVLAIGSAAQEPLSRKRRASPWPGGAGSNRQDPISGCREAIVGGAPETQSAQAIGAAYDRRSASRDQSLAIEFLCIVAGDFSERCANVIPSLGGAPTRGAASSVKACFALGRWSGTICTIVPSVTRLKSAATSFDLIRMQP